MIRGVTKYKYAVETPCSPGRPWPEHQFRRPITQHTWESRLQNSAGLKLNGHKRHKIRNGKSGISITDQGSLNRFAV